MNRVLGTAAFLAFSFAAIGSAPAQVYPAPPPVVSQPGYPGQPPPVDNPQGCRLQVTPAAQTIYEHVMRHFAPLNLTQQQQQQIQSIVDAFGRMHPAGSPRDAAAMYDMHQRVRGVLSPQQLSMLERINHERPPMQHRCR